MENPASNERKILNPFSLPNETNGRFYLLIIAVISMALLTETYISSFFEESKISVLLIFLALVFTFLISYLFYRRHPKKIIRKQKLIRIDQLNDEKYSALIKKINKLSTGNGIKNLQIYLSAAYNIDAQIFGFNNKNFIMIDNGLRMLMYKNEKKFEAVILHELSHILNKDIGKTYFSESIWKTTLFFGVIPIAIASTFFYLYNINANNFYTKSINYFHFVFSLCFIIFVMFLILKSILRKREFYADCKAAFLGAKESIKELFTEAEPINNSRNSIKKFFSWHPSIKERFEVIKNPERLFLIEKELLIVSGVLIPLSIFLSYFTAFTSLHISSYFAPSSSEGFNFILTIFSFFIFLIPSFTGVVLTGFFISSCLSCQMQNCIINHTVTKKRISFKGGLADSLILTIGVVMGLMFLPLFSPLLHIGVFDFIILTFIILITNFLWMGYIKILSSAFYKKYLKNKMPKARIYFVNVISTFLLILFYTLVLVIYFSFIAPGNLPSRVIYFSIFAIFLIFCIALGTFVSFNRLSRPKCPECNQPQTDNVLLGNECKNCGKFFGEWLIIREKFWKA